jgi:RNA polymerase subunit RPABC4/transcription elongation factor Spt4
MKFYGAVQSDVNLNVNPIFVASFKIPPISILGDQEMCAICHDPVLSSQPRQTFTTQCGHLFHMPCIFAYLRFNKLVKACDHCSYVCITECFKCPICNRLVHESFNCSHKLSKCYNKQ